MQASAIEGEGSYGGLDVSHAEAGADYCSSGPKQVPSQTDAWRDVLVVCWVGFTDTVAHLHDPLRGHEIRQPVLRILDGIGYVIAQTKTQGKSARGAELILQIKSKGFHAEISARIAKQQFPGANIPLQEILQVVKANAAATVTRSK